MHEDADPVLVHSASSAASAAAALGNSCRSNNSAASSGWAGWTGWAGWDASRADLGRPGLFGEALSGRDVTRADARTRDSLPAHGLGSSRLQSGAHLTRGTCDADAGSAHGEAEDARPAAGTAELGSVGGTGRLGDEVCGRKGGAGMEGAVGGWGGMLSATVMRGATLGRRILDALPDD